MKILENKTISIVLMLVLILAGFLLGGYKGLASQYQKVEDVFFLGEDRDGIGIANDMAERASALTNMQTIATKYLESDCAELTTAETALATYSKAVGTGEIGALFAANAQMDTAMQALYNALGALENSEQSTAQGSGRDNAQKLGQATDQLDGSLSEKDESYRQRLYADFNSRNDTISHDPYYSYAAEYNKLLDGFPAKLICLATPAKSAVLQY